MTMSRTSRKEGSRWRRMLGHAWSGDWSWWSAIRSLPGIAIVALVAGLLVPLPPVVVDVLLSTSLAGSVALLVISLRVERTSEFSSLPPLLLLTTLFRLVLNVSTTRLILERADAGRVIDAFAAVVIRGDLVIGAVMFAIISALQFLVIARGSERVAEVGARFALDALPGQQAAIESELRSGACSPRKAAQRRARLMERSNFFGRMDGAVRFVRGDAVLGLTITGINLLGGIAIGALRHDAGIAESLMLYGQLTIGDGLAAQIPALLVSLSAAVLVARVERESEDGTLDARAAHRAWGSGHDDAIERDRLPTWLRPEAAWVPATLLLVLALVPGMPSAVFGAVAFVLIAAGVVISASRGSQARRTSHDSVLVLSVPDVPSVTRSELSHAVEGARRRCEVDLAIIMPRLRVRFMPRTSRERGAAPAVSGDDRAIVEYCDRRLAEFACGPTRSAPDPSTPEEPTRLGAAACAVDVDRLVLGFYRAMAEQAEYFVDLQSVETGMEHIRARRPELVARAKERLDSGEILLVIRAWLRERLRLPSLESLLEEIVLVPKTSLAAQSGRWPELLRRATVHSWLHDLIDGPATTRRDIRWLQTTPDDEALLAESTVDVDGRASFSGRRATLEQWRRHIAEIRVGEAEGRACVVVTGQVHRTVLVDVVEQLAPRLAVVSREECAAAGIGELHDVASRIWLRLPVCDPFDP